LSRSFALRDVEIADIPFISNVG